MSAQLSLFGPAAGDARRARLQARRRDPDTSHIAAEVHEAGGRAPAARAIVLSTVRRFPGLTAAQYGRLTGLGHIEAQRRLSDLKRDGLLEMGERIECPVNGSLMRTWNLAPQEPAE